jgi:hypothetical protein
MVAHEMAQEYGLGLLATIEGGVQHLYPVEVLRIDGEVWAPASSSLGKHLQVYDGQHVEVLLLEDSDEEHRVRGVLSCSRNTDDLSRLKYAIQAVQADPGSRITAEYLLKIVPDVDEQHPAWAQRRAA